MTAKFIGPQPAPQESSEFITRVPWRRSGTLQYTDDVKSLKRQLHANRQSGFAVYRRVKGTYDYELAFWLHEVPNTTQLPYNDLDKFIDDLLA